MIYNMQAPDLESKRIFLVATHDEVLMADISKMIQKHVKLSTVFTAADGLEALFKADNVFPHVAIIESQLAKTQNFEVVRKFLKIQKEHSMSLIILSNLPEQEEFIDEVVTGQVQFVSPNEVLQKLPHCLHRALNRISFGENSFYKLRFLSANETLLREGERTHSVFIVRSGEMKATKNGVLLGQIKAGEFVGEMAHINDDNHFATVEALTDCELIEIPSGTLDLVLFSKPAWSKALISTLSKRLKKTNSQIVEKA